MGSIGLKDIPRYSVSGVEANGEAVACGSDGTPGSILNLNGAEVSLTFETMSSEDTPVLRLKDNNPNEYFLFGEADNAGVQIPKWTVRGYVSREKVEDMITLGRIIFMCQTKGFKQLYSSTDANFRDFVAYSKYGEREHNGESVKTVEYINVRIKSLSITQGADKRGFNYTINLIETN